MNAPVQTAAATDKGPSPIAVLRNQLEKMEPQFKAALPAHMPVERFMRVVMTAIQNNPDLVGADRQSLWNAAMRAAQDGLLPDGREGAIVIYNTKVKVDGKDRWIKKAQWMPMVFGILKKIRNSGQVAMIVARVVCAGDNYRNWIDDEGEHLLYEEGEERDRNVVRKVFAAAKTKEGELLVEPLTPEDIEKIRSVSRAKDNGPWVDWWEEMAKKSAIRRLSKRLPMSTDLDDLIRRDDDLYDFGGARETGAQATAQKPQLVKNLLDRFAAESEPGEQRPPENGEAPQGDQQEQESATDEASADEGGVTVVGSTDHANGAEPSRDTSSAGQTKAVNAGVTSAGGEQPATSVDPAAKAMQRGWDARKAGMSRKAVPPEYREPKRKTESDAWLDGYDKAVAAENEQG